MKSYYARFLYDNIITAENVFQLENIVQNSIFRNNCYSYFVIQQTQKYSENRNPVRVDT